MMLTMLFGSFIGGASSEGGGAVAFPVLTLLMSFDPLDARNFSFAIQSIGMTSASLLIISRKAPIYANALLPISLGGTLGLLLGTYYVLPHMQPAYIKLFFVSLWLSFGFVLFYINILQKKKRIIAQKFTPTNSLRTKLLFTGLIGGVVTALTGNGIDIFSFCILVIYLNASIKKATTTSVILMSISTVQGLFLHGVILKDFNASVWDIWLACVPVVVLFAPLGAYLVMRIRTIFIELFLYLVIVAQFVGALLIIRPSGGLWLFVFVVFGAGIGLFGALRLLSKKSVDSTSIKA